MWLINKLKQLNTKTLIGLSIIAIILIVFTISYLVLYFQYKSKTKEYNKLVNTEYQTIYNHRADSLDNIIATNKYTIHKDSITIDSLNKVKQHKSIIYEKEIKDFSIPSIVSDDSISRYISNKLHNK